MFTLLIQIFKNPKILLFLLLGMLLAYITFLHLSLKHKAKELEEARVSNSILENNLKQEQRKFEEQQNIINKYQATLLSIKRIYSNSKTILDKTKIMLNNLPKEPNIDIIRKTNKFLDCELTSFQTKEGSPINCI